MIMILILVIIMEALVRWCWWWYWCSCCCCCCWRLWWWWWRWWLWGWWRPPEICHHWTHWTHSPGRLATSKYQKGLSSKMLWQILECFHQTNGCKRSFWTPRTLSAMHPPLLNAGDDCTGVQDCRCPATGAMLASAKSLVLSRLCDLGSVFSLIPPPGPTF